MAAWRAVASMVGWVECAEGGCMVAGWEEDTGTTATEEVEEDTGTTTIEEVAAGTAARYLAEVMAAEAVGIGDT